METIIMIIALVAVAALAAYCIITKSNQDRIRSWIYIGAFIAFVLLALIGVIHWVFTWYVFSALLLTLATLGTWTLVHTRKEKAYKAWRIVVYSTGTFLLVLVTMIPTLIFPQYTAPQVTGKHPVATVNYTYTDENRIETFTNTGEHRKVNAEFWYPKDGEGKYPLVVFSHGTSAIKISNTSTFIELASNGYVVCSIDHPYHSLFTVGADGHLVTIDQAYLKQYMDVANGKYDESTSFKLHQKWIQLRTADINFVLDTIVARAGQFDSGVVYQLVDPEKIGLIGHSLGGESVAQVARERNDIDAVVNLDSVLSGEYLDYVDGKYVMNDKVFPAPILTILADGLVHLIAAVPDANNVIPLNHVDATAPHAYLVHINGTDHMSFTDLPLFSPLMVSLITASVPQVAGGQPADKLAVIEKVNGFVLQFFNAFLKGQGTFAIGGTY